jgi:hypothetical protein
VKKSNTVISYNNKHIIIDIALAHFDVLTAGVDQPLVDLIADTHYIIALTEIGHQLQL